MHSEVLTPGLADLIKSGAVTNHFKKINTGKSVFAFSLGDRALFDYMNENLSIESHPVEYVNDPAVISQNDNVFSVNSTIEMDLTGACNSEHVNGHQFTSSGGQLDFVRGAYASRGGISVMAFQSAVKNCTISKIVPRLSGPGHDPTHRYSLRRHGKRSRQSEGSVLYRTGAGTDRPGPSLFPG